MRIMNMTHVQDSATIAADPLTVYAMLTDITRMGEWSPENCGGRWLGQAAGPAAGARFVGRNRKGPLRWSTVCTVTAADPGHVFAFTVKALGLTVSQWSYVFEDAEGGCVVTERWTDRRPAAARSLGDLVMGVRDRGEHNLAGIRTTLANVKSTAESVSA
jgi:hypothetical protein